MSDDQRPSRRGGFVVAAVVVGVLVLLGVVITLARGEDEPVVSDPPTAATGTLSQPPEEVTWELVGTIALPATEAAGPGIVDESGLRYCYAHTPEGALLMAANVFAWGEASDPTGILENSISEGPGYDAAKRALSAGEAGAPVTTRTHIRSMASGCSAITQAPRWWT